MAQIIYYIIIGIAMILLCMDRRRLLYFFVFMYPILPEYLSISVSSSLPLFTASRMLLIIMFLLVLIEGRINFYVFRMLYFGKAFTLFLLCETVVCFAHIHDMNSVKTYISVLLENLALVLILISLVDNKKKFENCMKIVLCAAGFVFFMGVLEPITKFNFASTFLDTGVRNTMLISAYERYNSIRAVFSFGHAIALGVFCIAILPFAMSKINETNRIRYYILFEIGLGCLLMTMSRGVIIVFALIFGLSLIQLNRSDRKGYWKVLGTTSIAGCLVLLLIPSIRDSLIDTVLDSLNALGANFSVGNSGGNDNAVLSRMAQLSYISQILNTYPICGGGTGYLDKGILYVRTATRSFRGRSVDIQFLSTFIRGGLVAFIGEFILYISVLKASWKEYRLDRDETSKAFFFSFLSIFLGYLTVAQLTTGNILWLLIGLFIIHFSLNEEEKLVREE